VKLLTPSQNVRARYSQNSPVLKRKAKKGKEVALRRSPRVQLKEGRFWPPQIKRLAGKPGPVRDSKKLKRGSLRSDRCQKTPERLGTAAKEEP